MPALDTFFRRARSFLSNRRGAISIQVTLMMPLFMFAAAGVADYTRAERLREHLQQSVDAGVLAAASNTPRLTGQELTAFLDDFVDANLRASRPHHELSDPVLSITEGDQTIYVEAESSISTYILGYFDRDYIDLKVSTEVTLGVGDRPVEVVLVSDLSGSMGGSIVFLREGMQSITDNLLARAANPGQVKIGYVPYVASVNIGADAPSSWLDVDGQNPTHGVNFENHTYEPTNECGKYRWRERYTVIQDKYSCRSIRNHSHNDNNNNNNNNNNDNTPPPPSNGGFEDAFLTPEGDALDAEIQMAADGRFDQLLGALYGRRSATLDGFAAETLGVGDAQAHTEWRNWTCWGNNCANKSDCSLQKADATRTRTRTHWYWHDSVDPDTAEWCEEKSTPDEVNHFELFAAAYDVDWAGCVEARPDALDEFDTPPNGANASSLWVPFFWPDEPDNKDTLYLNDWLDDGPTDTRNKMRRNDREQFSWTGPPPHQGTGSWAGQPDGAGWGYITGAEADRLAYWRKYDGGEPKMNVSAGPNSTNYATYGPNKSCPPPITPLTNDIGELNSAIARIEPYAGGGTMSNLGMAWAWRVLSPAEPFTQGGAYDDTHKVVVLMSDGDSNWQWRGTDAHHPVVRTHYTAYGYLSPLGEQNRNVHFDGAASHGEFIAGSGGRDFLDEKLKRVCDRMKENNIEIFTILFDPSGQAISDQTREAYRYCSSQDDDYMYNPSVEHYFEAFTDEQLVEAYDAIGSSLENVRLVQ